MVVEEGVAASAIGAKLAMWPASGSCGFGPECLAASKLEEWPIAPQGYLSCVTPGKVAKEVTCGLFGWLPASG